MRIKRLTWLSGLLFPLTLVSLPSNSDAGCSCHYGNVPIDHRVEAYNPIELVGRVTATVVKKSVPHEKKVHLTKEGETGLGSYGTSDVQSVVFEFKAKDPDSDVCEPGNQEVSAKLVGKSGEEPKVIVKQVISGQEVEIGSKTFVQADGTWTATWPSAGQGGVYVFEFSGKVEDLCQDHPDSNDPEDLDVSGYRCRLVMIQVRVSEGTDRFAPVVDQGGTNELVAVGTPEGGAYHWQVVGVEGAMGDANAASTYFVGDSAGDGTATVEYTFGGATCSDSIDLHVWEVDSLELLQPPAVGSSKTERTLAIKPAHSNELNKSNVEDAGKGVDKKPNQELKEVFLNLDGGSKELQAVLKGVVGDLPPGMSTASDNWKCEEGDSVELQDNKNGDARVLVVPKQTGISVIAYTATDKQAPANKERGDVTRPPVKVRVTVLKIDIGDYFRDPLPTEYWFFPSFSDSNFYQDRQWPTAIGAPNDKGTFKWDILGTKGFGAIGIVTKQKQVSTIVNTDEPRIFIVTRGYSDAKNDVTLRLTYTTPDGKCTCICEKNLTVRTFKLLLGAGAEYAKFGTGGWSMQKVMGLVDHLDQKEIPHGVDINEMFTNWESIMKKPKENWESPQAGGLQNAKTWSDLVWKPRMVGDTPAVEDSWLTTTVPNYIYIADQPPTKNADANVGVDKARQTWRYGSAVPGNGDTPIGGQVVFQRNRGFATHSN